MKNKFVSFITSFSNGEIGRHKGLIKRVYNY